MQKENEKGCCIIYLVRHGETEWYAKNITQGQSNESSLSEIGILQAKKVGEKFKQIKFHAIFSSDLSRAYKTAEIIKLDRKIKIKKSKLLRERSHGIFEGKHVDVMKNSLKDKLKERESLSGSEYSSFRLASFIETDEELVIRVINQLKKISQTYLNKSVLVVTHGGCIKNFLIKIGYADRKTLSSGSFKHGEYVILLSDGLDFFVKEASSIKSKGVSDV